MCIRDRVTVVYQDDVPVAVSTVVVSVQHDEDVPVETIRREVKEASSPVFCRPLPYSLRNKETVLISFSSIPVISAISSTRRLPSSPRPKCTRISIPDAIWRRIASVSYTHLVPVSHLFP